MHIRDLIVWGSSGQDTLGAFPPLFYKGENFSDLLFCYPVQAVPYEKGLL